VRVVGDYGDRPFGAIWILVLRRERCFERWPKAVDQSEALAPAGSVTALASPPVERRGDVGQDRLNDMRVVGDAKLVRDCQE
jgi:hypothetical protein